jgi:hypothetical protein
MVQITATIEEDAVKEIDRIAAEQGISRSRWIALAIHSHLAQMVKRDPAGASDLAGTALDDPLKGAGDTWALDRDHMKGEMERLMHEMEGKNQVIKLQSDEIGWLRGECAKLTDHVLLALPSPRKHWWEIWRPRQ